MLSACHLACLVWCVRWGSCDYLEPCLACVVSLALTTASFSYPPPVCLSGRFVFQALSKRRRSIGGSTDFTFCDKLRGNPPPQNGGGMRPGTATRGLGVQIESQSPCAPPTSGDKKDEGWMQRFSRGAQSRRVTASCFALLCLHGWLLS